jgi:hypothetical protein
MSVLSTPPAAGYFAASYAFFSSYSLVLILSKRSSFLKESSLSLFKEKLI